MYPTIQLHSFLDTYQLSTAQYKKVTELPFLLGSNATFQLSILSNNPKQLFPIKTLSNMFGWVYLVTWALYTSPSTPSVGKARPNVSRLVVAKRSK